MAVTNVFEPWIGLYNQEINQNRHIADSRALIHKNYENNSKFNT